MADSASATIGVRINIPDLRTQKSVVLNRRDTVFAALQLIMKEISLELLKDPNNYGLYLPANVSWKQGKFLDETRLLGEYPLPEKTPLLELLYKKRDFSQYDGNVSTKTLSKANSKSNLKKLSDYIQSGSVKKLRKILETAIDPNFVTEDGNTPLGIACGRNGHIECILPLLTGGAYVDYRGKDGLTPMHRAAIGGNTAAIKMLLSLGASPNYIDTKGLTPLYHAAIMGDDMSCCEALLKHRSNVGIKDQTGWSELHQVSKHGHTHLVDLLLTYGSPINDQNNVGNTPLHVAATHGQIKCCLLLMKRGANRHTQNYTKQVPNQLAIRCGHHQLAKMITTFSDDDVELLTQQPVYNPMARASRVTASSPQKPEGSAATLPRKPHSISTTTDVSLKEQKAATMPRQRKPSSSPPPSVGRIAATRKASNASSKGEDNEGHSQSDQGDTQPTEADSSDSQSSTGNESTESSTKRPGHRYSSSRAGATVTPPPLTDTMRERWYPCAQAGKTFIATRNVTPQQAGDIAVKKGEKVQVLFMGKGGYCEGRVGDKHGWFPYNVVLEEQKANKGLK